MATNRLRGIGALLVALSAAALYAQAPVGTAFTYQGQLKQAGAPLTGTADFQFSLWDAAQGGTQIGSTVAANAVTVQAGLFTAAPDFGAAVFDGNARWLEIAVRSPAGGGTFTTVSPRQPLHAAPFSLTTRGISVDAAGNVGLGTTTPLDKLHVAGAAAILRLQADGDPASYTVVNDASFQQLRLEKRSASSYTLMDINPMPLDGVSNATIRFFRSTNTTGGKTVVFNRGDNTTGASAVIGVDGADSWFQADGGNFAIGTTAPAATLHVVNGTGLHAIWAECSGIPVYALRNGATGTWPAVHGDCSSTADGSSGVRGTLSATTPGGSAAGVYGFVSSTGSNGAGVRGRHYGSGKGVLGEVASADGYAGYFVGGRNYFQGNVGIGTAAPDIRLHVEGGSDVEPGSGGFVVAGSVTGANLAFDNNEIMARNNGAVSTLYLNNNGGEVHIGGATSIWGNLTIRSRDTNAVLIELGEGLDYAEGFDVSDKDAITPGAVVVIDPRNPGKLMLSTAAYDRKVAGIVAGANGLGSAVRLGAGQFDHDVALAGRVYCQVDATEHGIEPGDLLTTSSRPGHAMKVTDHARAQGAILGKAMEPLKQGETGQILVLVTLQ